MTGNESPGREPTAEHKKSNGPAKHSTLRAALFAIAFLIVVVVGTGVYGMLVSSDAGSASQGTPQAPTPNPAVVTAQTSITTNDDWTPVEQDVDGVTMVLVPVGCFGMGHADDGEDMQPVHEQCFDTPFWIDKYEVTNAQYGAEGCRGSTGPEQPRSCVSWYDALAHCQARGGRLPTEVEWAYAARGPDEWIFPWRGGYDLSRLVGLDSPDYGGRRTADVTERPRGASWVGAMHMTGNVWEWTSSTFAPYPYVADDGREDVGSDALRVKRGGSFNSGTGTYRVTVRHAITPSTDDDNALGFRCAVDS